MIICEVTCSEIVCRKRSVVFDRGTQRFCFASIQPVTELYCSCFRWSVAYPQPVIERFDSVSEVVVAELLPLFDIVTDPSSAVIHVETSDRLVADSSHPSPLESLYDHLSL